MNNTATLRVFGCLAIVSLLSAGCVSSGKKLYIGEAEWQERVEKQGLDPDEVVYPFITTPEMREFASKILGQHQLRSKAAQLTRLQMALFNKEVFHFKRDDKLTLTASEAFAERRGNCFSFTSLFVSLARSLGYETFMVSVERPPEVKRDQGLVVVTQHIVAGYIEGRWLHLYDFFMTSQDPYESERYIGDVKASAMYHSNLGGVEIGMGNLDEANRHLRIATRLDAELASAWVNLGVLRYRSGEMRDALECYQRALRAEPGMPSALTNVAYVHRSLGEEDKANAAFAAAAQGQASPFALIAMADAETSLGNRKAASRYLRRAKRHYPKEPEVYEALAEFADSAGNQKKALKYRGKAEALRLLRE
ncbi:MAG: tetratricopeptide repeat protein [bacterium]|nr:tetratricopeptide repeat protein [bacterium]